MTTAANGHGGGDPDPTSDPAPGPPSDPPPPDHTLIARLKLFTVCLLLIGAALSLDPPMIVGDTKIDLVIDPFGFLERALHLWDPAYFGQIQNQAYGYLFPNGPFHAALIALDMPPWLVQRVWMAVLLCAAFLGVVRVAGALGVGTLHTRIVAGVGYALAPRVLTLISYNSAELQPMMLLPWILLPLVHGARRGRSPRRMAALSALAFLLCGGTNAASELAVLVVPLLYLLTRARGPRKRRLLGWWLAALFLVSFWWLVPLLLMGRYVYSFMPFTEDAGTTTGVTSLLNALRGTSNWMGYVPTEGQPALPAGAELSTEPWLIAVTALVAGLGLAGLLDRRTPERAFLLLTALTGTAIVTAGYTGEVTGPFAPAVQSLLDGALSPFRNIHKFDAVIRLPVVLGLAQLPVAIGRDAAGRRAGLLRALAVPPGAARRAAAGVSAVTLAATLTPVATVGIATRGGFERIPGYWYEAAAWIDANARAGMTMAVPGSARGEYEWGRPMDEPMQPLLESAWTNQQIIPWGSAGVSRLTHAIDQRLSSGRGSEGLTRALARMGVTHLLVRNDLQRNGNNGGWPARVHQALADSPGITREAAFGPGMGSLDVHRAAEWYDQPYPALEVYQVRGAAPTVSTVPADSALRVTGGPESLLALAEQGMLDGDRPVLIGDDPGAEDIAAKNTIATDTSRRREVVYSDVRHNITNTLTAEEERRATPAPDVMDPAWRDYTSVATNKGIASVTASSAESWADTPATRRDPGRAPFAALDGIPETSWRSSGFSGAVGQWLEIEFSEPREVGDLTISFERFADEPPPAQISLITDDESATVPVAATGRPQEVTAPSGTTSRLRIRVDELAWEPEYRFGTRVGISDVTLSGLEPARPLRVPGTADAGTVLFTGAVGSVPGCMEGSRVWVCNPDLAVQGEDALTLDRTFEVSREAAAGRSTITGQAVVTDPMDVENAANRAGGHPKVTASSTSVRHPAAMGRNAFDGDDSTIWYPDPAEDTPSLDVRLGEATRLDGLRVEFPRADSVTRPVRVRVETDSTVREGWLDGSGWVDFAPLRADELTITFERPEGQPLEIREIALPDVEPAEPPDSDASAETACGLGPVLRVNGERVETRITSGGLGDKLSGQPLRFESCGGDVGLTGGENRLVVEEGNQYRVRSAVLGPAEAGERAEVRAEEVATVTSWGGSERRIEVSAEEDSYLVVNENFNDGWVATVDATGARLDPVRLDGWKQAWRLPAGTTGGVTLTYAPDTAYQAALGVGAALALLAGVLALPRRPHRDRVAARRASRNGAARRRPERLAAALPARVGRPVLLGAGPLYGLWVGGAVGAAVVAVAMLLVWWLGRSPSSALRHARPGRPALGGAVLRWLAGRWTVVVSLAGAGLSMAIGTHLALALPFHDVSERFGDVLRDVVPQLLCLPVLARLAVALGTAPAWARPGPDGPSPPEANGERSASPRARPDEVGEEVSAR